MGPTESNVVPLRAERLDDAYAAALGRPDVQEAIRRARTERRLIAIGRLIRRLTPRRRGLLGPR